MADAKFWDKAAKKYAASRVKDMAAYEETLDRARDFLRPEDHLLEVGCGTGTTALTLSSSLRRITATDISGTMLAIAQEKQQNAHVSNVEFVRSEITQPLPDAPFDAICAFSILHLVDDLPTALTHLHKQLKPGGYIISKTACLKDMNIFVRIAVKLMKAVGKAPHVLIFNADELEDEFRQIGYEIVEAGYFGTNRYARFIIAKRPA